MNARAGIVALLFGQVLFAGPALADVYAWVDEEGIVHYEDEPPAKRKRVKNLRAPTAERPGAEALPPPSAPSREGGGPKRGTPPPQPASSARRPNPAPTVELFTTSWCPWCKKARAYFNSRGIRFTDHDIEREPGALERKVHIDGDQRVPTAIIGGRVIKGYSPSGYQAALEQP
jgi:glutaredoxin